jgi:ABC transporter substrate binding protein
LAGLKGRMGLALVWVFNLWGAADLLYAFYQGNAVGLDPRDLGSGYFILTVLVPLLLITHALIFWAASARRDRSPCAYGSGHKVKERPGALMVLASSLTHRHLRQIADLAVKHKLPSIMEFSEFTAAGGLLMYGPTWAGMFQRGGALIGKILKGAKPAELPVEQPTRFALFVNLRTAKALGLEVPPTLLARADEVIE